ncbi:HAD-IIB family hydrolase [Clostridioides sp. ES-S-0077-01]|uniref:HAD-IIB family hydrolase n=2 Tax=Clostridioides TaxID=1870884 RepID=UPI001D62C1F8|nr:HAD-IIB family hydrolase [Clostridioides sp. ES-S-0077-01]
MMNTILMFDLDGTLIDSNNEVIGGKRTINLLKKLQTYGIRLMANTGRLDHDAYYIDHKYGLQIDCRISQNGAVIQNEQEIQAKLLNKEEAKKLYNELRNLNIRVELNTVSNRYWHSDRDKDFPKEYYDSSKIVEDFKNIIEYQPIVLFLIIGELSEIEKLQSHVNENYKYLEAVKTSNTSLEILQKYVSKGNKIKEMYPNSKIISIGDSENDYSMFEKSDLAYYVGNESYSGPAQKMTSILEALEDIERRILK